MKRCVAHWDAPMGISGDMALAAAIDAGARLEVVNAALAALGIPGLRVETATVRRAGIRCCQVCVRWAGDGCGEGAGGKGTHLEETASPHPPEAPTGHGHHGHGAAGAHHGRTYADIRSLIQAAPLDSVVRERALAVFARLAAAEGRVHGLPPEEVHFHEVGGEDAIADVVGTCAALADLGVGSLTVSPLPAGGGSVEVAHGQLPVPAPATAYLLAGFDVVPGPVAAELVTPTGAALVAALARPTDSWPAMRVGQVGWGAGRADFPGRPNALRLVCGEAPEGAGTWIVEGLVELETHIDDQTPQGIGYLYERLFEAGALDVAVSPVAMKKQRPGVRLWALVPPDRVEAAARCLFAESTALGVRVRPLERWSLPRALREVQTGFGPVRVKLAFLDGVCVNAAPEYEDCVRAARATGVPLKLVFHAALQALGALPSEPVGGSPEPR